jgi:hypothetical protein
VGERWQRLLLWILAVSAASVGLWAQFFPKSFYDSFPGSGRHWISADGPYNEHLVRDVGALNLALAVVTIFAAVSLGPTLVRAASAAWLTYSVPHLTYHLFHLDLYDTSDKVGNVVSLGFLVVVPAVLLAASLGAWRSRSAPSPTGSPTRLQPGLPNRTP